MGNLENIINYVKKKRKIYIYGAGEYGQCVFDVLITHDIKVECFLVKKKEIMTIKGTMVCELKDVLHDINKEDGIILALKMEYQKEVIKDFPELLCMDIFCLTAKDLLELRHFEFLDKVKELVCLYPPSKVINKEKWGNILIIRLDLIGDFVVTTPFIRELRRNFPNAKITLIVRREIQDMLTFCPYIDRVIGVEYKIENFHSKEYEYLDQKARQLVENHLAETIFDVVFLPRFIGIDDLFLNVLLAVYSRAKVRIARCDTFTESAKETAKIFSKLFSVLVRNNNPTHEVKRILDLLTAVDISYISDRMELWYSEEDAIEAEKLLGNTASYRIAVGVVSSEKKRSWDRDKYCLLINRIHSLYSGKVSFVLLGGGDAAETANYICKKTRGAVDLTEKTSMTVASAVLSKCDIYVGANTGLLHIASAAGKPVVEISAHLKEGDSNGGIAPQRYGAWKVPYISIQPIHGLDDECERIGSCVKSYAHCINQITVDEVVGAVVSLMAVSNDG